MPHKEGKTQRGERECRRGRGVKHEHGFDGEEQQSDGGGGGRAGGSEGRLSSSGLKPH